MVVVVHARALLLHLHPDPCAVQEPAPPSAAAPPEKKPKKPKVDKEERAGPSWERPKGQSNGASKPPPPPSAAPKPDAAPPPGPKVFRVAAILKKRLSKKGEVEYLIQWDGYGEDHNSWEPKANIFDTNLIRAFEANWEPELPPEKKKRPAKQPSDGGASARGAGASGASPSGSKGAGSSSSSKGAGKGAGKGGKAGDAEDGKSREQLRGGKERKFF